ncbi:hypothetical protein N7G274_005798 [Stereocaulon virgatum]|uniref:Uncharacterized protein n=1 Tax=Stereocaulon virgatum TaxID=373712 RepID=A0ABR4A930_9LECA
MSGNIHPSPFQLVNQSLHQPTKSRTQLAATAPNNGSAPQNRYLSYAPAFTGNGSYTSHFERLGFRIDNTELLIRERFISDPRSHVDGSHYKVLTKHDNARVFNTVIAEFLSDLGRLYWGPSARENLAEPDILEGFCCPRDANRAGLKLVGVLEHMFEYDEKLLRAQR